MGRGRRRWSWGVRFRSQTSGLSGFGIRFTLTVFRFLASRLSGILLCQPLDLEILCGLQELCEVGLGDVAVAVVDECENTQYVRVTNSAQIKQRVLVRVVSQDPAEEGGAGRQHQLVSSDLEARLPAESNIVELLALPELSEG